MLDLTGRRFGKLLVINRSGERHRGYTVWECHCDCGQRTFVPEHRLISGNTRSCGCLQRETASKRFFKYGYTRGKKTPEYQTWIRMRSRCLSKSNPDYHYYGGRGIGICQEWDDFETFLKDMGEKPGPEYTLERRNNSGGYCKENCIWATRLTQANNTSQLRRFLALGPCGQIEVAKSQGAFARKWGLNRFHIGNCLSGRRKRHKGWVFQKLIIREEYTND